jgi:hypothetical protein
MSDGLPSGLDPRVRCQTGVGAMPAAGHLFWPAVLVERLQAAIRTAADRAGRPKAGDHKRRAPTLGAGQVRHLTSVL